jgi:acyl-CoA synthetase (AMP-forming)/AMP-acid ligase II
VTVYGVEVPRHDGRAGMASIVVQDHTQIDWTHFHAECVAHLPSYARPLFLRIQNQIQTTATFKHQKNQLVKEGFNPANMTSDDLHFYSNGQVTPLTEEIYEKIQSGAIKL